MATKKTQQRTARGLSRQQAGLASLTTEYGSARSGIFAGSGAAILFDEHTRQVVKWEVEEVKAAYPLVVLMAAMAHCRGLFKP